MKSIKQFFTSLNKEHIIAVIKTSREIVLYGVVIGIFFEIKKPSIMSIVLMLLMLSFVYLVDIAIVLLSIKNK